jgi:hypothetical protein
VGLGLPEEFRAILAIAPELRSPAQRETLMAHFRSVDAEHRKRTSAVNQSRAPLPPDATLQQLRARVAEAKQPVPVDPRLAQLRRDVDMSINQEAARRLTAAQDVVWALINSPAFLFNH